MLVSAFAITGKSSVSVASRRCAPNSSSRNNGAERIRRDKNTRGSDNAEAYQAFLRGRYYRNKRTGEGYQKAIECFELATKLDPGYALAHSALADSYVSYDFYGILPPWETSPKAKAAAINALVIDDTLAESHTALACVKMMYERDWSNAEREFKRTIELDPEFVHAHNWYSHFLMAMGRIDESFAENQIALKLDPLNDSINQYLGWHHIHARQFDRAITQLEKTLANAPDFFLARVTLGMAYEQKGEVAKAIEEFKKAYKLEKSSIVLGFLGHSYARAGNTREAQKILEELEELSKRIYVPPYIIGLIHTALGETTEAFEWFEKAYAAQNEWLHWLKVAPEVDTLRADPRFKDLLKPSISRLINNSRPTVKSSELFLLRVLEPVIIFSLTLYVTGKTIETLDPN